MQLFNRHTNSNEMAIILPLDILELKSITKSGQFYFNWRIEKRKELYKLQLMANGKILGLMALTDIPKELRIEINILESSKENIGSNKVYNHIAGCLIAYACRLAFIRGYYGFISLVPKTNLIKHYREVYGFEQAGRQLYLNFNNSETLIRKYL